MPIRRRSLPPGVDPVVRDQARAAGWIAGQVIAAVLRGRPADRELAARLKPLSRIHPRDGRFYSRVVFSLFRWWGWTRPLLEEDLPRGLLASYLLDSGPYHAVTTDWARRYRIPGGRLTPPPAEADLAARAAWLRAFRGEPKLRLNPLALVPAWFFRLLHNPHGRAFERELLEAFQRPAPLWIRTAGPVEGLELVRHPAVPSAARVSSEESLYRHPSFRNGAFEIQDLASQAVGLVCAPEPGERWWDACAGFGGKALQLAAMMKGRGAVVATDVKERKLGEARRRAARAGLHNLATRPWDGRRVPAAPASFDGVLVDAPCTGVGTWRRNPDARWRTSPGDVEELSAMQRSILSSAARGVRPGGRLVYAVCSLTRAETLDVTDAFLESHRDFSLAPAAHPLTGEPGDGRIWIWPQSSDSDGMFVAKFVRTSGAPA